MIQTKINKGEKIITQRKRTKKVNEINIDTMTVFGEVLVEKMEKYFK